MKIYKLHEVYEKCESSGFFKVKNEIDIELIKSLKKVAEAGLMFIKDKSKTTSKNSTDWTFVFRDYYETLRTLIEAYLLFNKIEAERHQCKNAYLCFRHSELDLSWEFLETVRLKRNMINYRGELLTYDVWKKYEQKFDAHIKILKEKLNEKINA